MNEMDFKILTSLNEERNITRVAKRMFMSQPALSYRIKEIENNIKAILFNRGRTGIVPTPEGDVLIKHAYEVLESMRKARETIWQLNSEVKGTIKIGAASTYGHYVLPHLLGKFLSEQPKVKVDIIAGFSTDMMQNLKKKNVQIALVRGSENWNEGKMLVSRELIYVVSKDRINLDNLPNEQYIHYHMDSHLQSIVDKWWKENFNVPKNHFMDVQNLAMSKEMVKCGIGYTILPSVCIEEEENLYIKPLEHPSGKQIIRETWAYYREDTITFPALKMFMKFLSDYQTGSLSY